jgi:hypothetical protein
MVTKAATEAKTKAKINQAERLAEAAMQILASEYGLADAALAQDEAGWLKVSGNSSALDMPPAERIATVQRARLYYNHDPLAKQAVRLWTGYALGKGMNWKAPDKAAQDTLNDFWNDPANRVMFSTQGQHKSSDRLLVDGELFLAIFSGAGAVHVRRIDPLQITEIISDPEDDETPRYYKRDYVNASSGKSETLYYADWKSDSTEAAPDASHKPIKATTDALIYHVTFNTLGQRGNSLLAVSMDWSKAHRKFMEARVAIMQALARFAWKVKTAGGAAQVAALKAQLGTTINSGSAAEGNPPASAGSTWIENGGIQLDSIKTESGAGSAQVDGSMLLQMLGVGMGIFPHYFGAGESFRLATATAMEAPMLKQFETYQQLWGDIYSDLFKYVLAENSVGDDQQFIDLDFPPIVQADVVAITTAVSAVLASVPGLDTPEVRKLLLTALGINNPDEVLKNIAPAEAASAQLVKALNRFTKNVKAKE